MWFLYMFWEARREMGFTLGGRLFDGLRIDEIGGIWESAAAWF
jgi:hypothetical protein